MIPILIVLKEGTQLTDQSYLTASEDMRKMPGPFTFVIADSQNPNRRVTTVSGYPTYDDARTSGVDELGRVLKRER